jgi:hypothetical protein
MVGAAGATVVAGAGWPAVAGATSSPDVVAGLAVVEVAREPFDAWAGSGIAGALATSGLAEVLAADLPV